MILSFFVYGDLFRPEGIAGGGVFCCNVRRGAAFGQYQVRHVSSWYSWITTAEKSSRKSKLFWV